MTASNRQAMNVLLINPRACSRNSVRLPLSLLSLAAVLEGNYNYRLIDGSLEPDAASSANRTLAEMPRALVGISVMPGPQVAPAIEISRAIRAANPNVPIVWGGYFPTLYPDAAINAPYVDYVARGQGEETLLDLIERLNGSNQAAPTDSAPHEISVEDVRGLTWKRDGVIIHNPDRPFRSPNEFPPLPYGRLRNLGQYLRPSFMGTRTAVHQAAIGCRYKCAFCGVVSMFNGSTRLQAPDRLLDAICTLKSQHGATAMQYYDNNFFDREESSIPILEALKIADLPWWCYARADTLANFSASTWELIRRSKLRMAYIGAESASDTALKTMKKGTRVEHTLEVARRCNEYGVIPEFSFILGGPEDPEAETERTFAFIKKIKRAHPDCEVILYFYSPTPQRESAFRDADGTSALLPILRRYGPDGPELPATPEEWTQPQWVSYVCHQDAPWLSPKMRRRVKDFSRVLGCRFPTVQDHRTPLWGKSILREMSRWRYSTGRYENPWELNLARRFIPLREPQKESL